jgi:Domain of unknown function (DUF4190)
VNEPQPPPPPPTPWSKPATDQPTYSPQLSQGAPPPPPPATYGVPAQQAVPYGYPGATPYPPGYGYAQPKTDGFAIASLVCSLTALFTCGVTSILAVIFGFVSRSRIKKSNGALAGEGQALAGLIIGFIGVGLIVVYIFAMVAASGN